MDASLQISACSYFKIYMSIDTSGSYKNCGPACQDGLIKTSRLDLVVSGKISIQVHWLPIHKVTTLYTFDNTA